MFSAEFVNGCVIDIYRMLKATTDPGAVQERIFQRQATLSADTAYGFFYDFQRGIICESVAHFQPDGRILQEPNEEGFYFIGQIRGQKLEDKIGLVEQAIQSIASHSFLQEMKHESHRSLNLTPDRLIERFFTRRRHTLN
jgi:hypothetical protein